MAEILRSVGLDVGTTSTQMILSELTVENRASGFAVPEMEITRRKILYKSPVRFTPLLDESHMDGEALRRMVEEEYRLAEITRETVDTGAIIITGETSRKENAQTVLEALSNLAGDFVVATAGPDLESVLAAKGAGAERYSEKTGRRVLHFDIGGGTSNLALLEGGKLLGTGCLNVGGRLIKTDESGIVTYVSPVLRDLCDIRPGEKLSLEREKKTAALLARALEMAAGLREPDRLLEELTTAGTAPLPLPGTTGDVILSFSGGVADCIREDLPERAFGDIGPALGRAIRGSRLCQGAYRLGEETIRATVIGAGCHSAQLSGSTVYCRDTALPIKNIPVLSLSREQQEGNLTESIRRGLLEGEAEPVIALPGIRSPSYRQVTALAEKILAGFPGKNLRICLEEDMAKALGQALASRTENHRSILCLDGVKLSPGSYLDVGAPVGPAMPIVVKTLILNQ